MCSKAGKKFNFATGIVGSHISSWIQVIFVSVFSFTSYSPFEFWDASIWNCKKKYKLEKKPSDNLKNKPDVKFEITPIIVNENNYIVNL